MYSRKLLPQGEGPCGSSSGLSPHRPVSQRERFAIEENSPSYRSGHELVSRVVLRDPQAACRLWTSACSGAQHRRAILGARITASAVVWLICAAPLAVARPI